MLTSSESSSLFELAASSSSSLQQQQQQQQQHLQLQQVDSRLQQLINATQPAANLASDLFLSNLSISEEEELRLLNFPSKQEDLSTAIPLTVIFALLLVTGCIGNLCTAIVIARPKNKYMHTATNYYLFSLAMSDFLFLILGLPQEMYQLWQRYPYAFGESFCIIRGYLSEASTYASILTISAFTVERYVAICHPLWAHTMSQLPRAVTSIVIIWLLAAICAIPPAAELGIVTQSGPISHKPLEQSAQCAGKRSIYENMFVVSAIVFFIVPMIIVTVLYILIAIELRRSSRMNSAISKQASSSQHQVVNNRHVCKHKLKRFKQQPVTYTISPSSSLALSHQNEPKPLISGGGHLKTSLMDDLMSRRPSSAIGNEGAAGLARPNRLRRLLLPAGLFGSGGKMSNTCKGTTCACQLEHHGKQTITAPTIQHSLSQQYPSVGHLPAERSQHSPLSYHESLVGPHHKQTGSGFIKATTGSRQLSKLRPFHQLSLTLTSTQKYDCQQQVAGNQRILANGGGQISRRSAAASSKKSVVRMLVAVVVSFFICWVPFHAQRLLASYLAKDENQNQVLLDIYLKLTYISGVMYYLSSTINPLLYQLMSAKFRLAFKETFNCSLFKCSIFHRRGASNSPSNSLKEPHLIANSPNPRGFPRFDSRASHLNASGTGALAGGCETTDYSALYEDCSCQIDNELNFGPNDNSKLGLLYRLRNRFNSSMLSLFGVGSQQAGNNECPCCLSGHRYQLAPGSQLDIASGCVTPVRLSSPVRRHHSNNNNNNNNVNIRLETAANKHLSGASTPLLAEHSEIMASNSPNGDPQSGNKFPAHSMLKFVRSPSPAQLNHQASCLTRLSSRDEEEEEQQPIQRHWKAAQSHGSREQPGRSCQDDSIKLANMESLVKPTCEHEENSGGINVLSLVATTSEESAGNSTAGSSPDQQIEHNRSNNRRANHQGRHNQQPHYRRKLVGANSEKNAEFCERLAQLRKVGGGGCKSGRRKKLSSGSSNGSATCGHTGDSPEIGRERRNSLQQQQQHRQVLYSINRGGYLCNYNQTDNPRRKSSSSSAAAASTTATTTTTSSAVGAEMNANRRFSSSFSSSDRHLEKKLSMSTTTSAIDCGSFTTTNSQLTNSNPALQSGLRLNGQLRDNLLSREPSSSATSSSSSCSPVEEEPTTVINIRQQEADSLLGEHEQVRLPLLLLTSGGCETDGASHCRNGAA